MNPLEDARAVLHWSVLTAKRPGLSRDLPPGQEKWAWVANSSTLIAGERDAVLVDTFLTTEPVADVAGLGGRERQESHRDLHHAWTRRSFLWPCASSSAVPEREGACDTRSRQGNGDTNITGIGRWILAQTYSRPNTRPSVGGRAARQK